VGGAASQIAGQVWSSAGQSMPDIGQMLINAEGFFTGITDFLPIFALMSGMVLLASSLYKAFNLSRENRDGRDHNGILGIVSSIVIASLMINWSLAEDMSSDLLSLSGSGGAFGYMPPTQTAYQQQVLHAVFTAISAIGAIGIFRGLLLWKQAGESSQMSKGDGGGMWSGFWHILGGAAALNIGPFIHMFGM